MGQKAAVKTDAPLRPAAAGSRTGGEFFEDQRLPESDRIQRRRVVLYAVLQVVVFVAGASERVFLSVHLDDGDFAAAVAMLLCAFAGERSAVTDGPVR